MKHILLALAAVFVFAAPARAQTTVITTDPRGYAQGLMDAMTLGGMRPLREAYTDMFNGAQLSANIETTLLVYERAIGQNSAHVARIADDVVLSDVLRVIYLYHYFGENSWVYTRLTFHAVGDGRWAMAQLSFADQWATIVVATSPGFRPAETPRR